MGNESFLQDFRTVWGLFWCPSVWLHGKVARRSFYFRAQVLKHQVEMLLSACRGWDHVTISQVRAPVFRCLQGCWLSNWKARSLSTECFPLEKSSGRFASSLFKRLESCKLSCMFTTYLCCHHHEMHDLGMREARYSDANWCYLVSDSLLSLTQES